MTTLNSHRIKQTSLLRNLVDSYFGRSSMVEARQYLKRSIDPYPGLRSFLQRESELFFGRKSQAQELGELFEKNNVVLVLGGSGSGKSSLVKAGLLPNLETIAPVAGREGRWYVVECRPRTNPAKEIAEALWRGVCEPLIKNETGDDNIDGLHALFFGLHNAPPPHKSDGKAIDTKQLSEICRQKFNALIIEKEINNESWLINPYGVYEFANVIIDRIDHHYWSGLTNGPATLFFLIDQFEEIFDDANVNKETRSSVIDLLRLSHINRGGLFIAITMRSESLHRCAEDPRLVDIVNRSCFLLELIDRRDVREAIVGPARRVLQEWGVLPTAKALDSSCSPFDPALVAELQDRMNELRDNLAHKPDSLPLLQHTLEVIWSEAMQRWSDELIYRQNVEPIIIRKDYEKACGSLDNQNAIQDRVHPFRRCLDIHADKCLDSAKQLLRKKGTLQNPYQAQPAENAVNSDEDADRILAACFASLARRDDRGNWVRDFATGRRLLEVSGVAKALNLSEQDILDALKTFLDKGYLQVEKQDGKIEYNVGHEALIRSWTWAQQRLENAEELKKALRYFNIAIEQRGSRGDYFPVSQYNAAQLVSQSQQQLLAEVMSPKSQFSRTWGVRALERRSQIISLTTSSKIENNERKDNIFESRFDSIKRLFDDARRWRSWGRTLTAIVCIMIIAIFSGWIAWTKNENFYLENFTDKTTLALQCIGRTTGDRSTLALDFDCAQILKLTEKSTDKEKRALDLYNYVQDRFGRNNLRALSGKMLSYNQEEMASTKAQCLSANNKTEVLERELGEITHGIAYFSKEALKSDDQLPGFYFFSKISDQTRQPLAAVPIYPPGLVCITDSADEVLIWNSNSMPVIFPLVWADKGAQSNLNKGVGVYAGSTLSDDFANKYAPDLSKMWQSLLDGNKVSVQAKKFGETTALFSLHTTNNNGSFKLSLVKAHGVDAPESYTKFTGPWSEVLCQPQEIYSINRDQSPQLKSCVVRTLDFEGRPYTLTTEIASEGNKFTCHEKFNACLQRITLAANDYTLTAGQMPAPRFHKDNHFSPRIKAVAISDGFLYLRDESGVVWRYILSFDKFITTMEQMEKASR